MNKKLIIASLLMLLMNKIAIGSEVESFASTGIRQVNWGLLDFSDAVEYDANLHTIIDFKADFVDDYYIGLIADIDSEANDNRKIAVQFGFDDWNFYYDTGKVTGKFASEPDLDVQPTAGTEFSLGYDMYAFYKGNSIGGTGYGYLEVELPTEGDVDAYNSVTDTSQSLRVIDPKAKFQLVGYYLFLDPAREILYANKSDGWSGEIRMLVGLGNINASREGAKLVEAATSLSIDNPSLLSIGAESSMRLGYYGGFKNGDGGVSMSYAFGYELQYLFILPIYEELDQNTVLQGENTGYMNHGLFAKLSFSW